MECRHGAQTCQATPHAVCSQPVCASHVHMLVRRTQGGAARYGTHPWHWYVTQGLPTVLGPGITPLALFGICSAARSGTNAEMGRHAISISARMRTTAARLQKNELVLAWLAMWVVVIYSTQPHKEFRFILCTLPMFAVYAGRGIAVLQNHQIFCRNQQVICTGTVPIAREAAMHGYAAVQQKPAVRIRKRVLPSRASRSCTPSRSRSHSPQRVRKQGASQLTQHRQRKTRAWCCCALLVLLNGPLAYYFGRWHQAAPISLVCNRCLTKSRFHMFQRNSYGPNAHSL